MLSAASAKQLPVESLIQAKLSQNAAQVFVLEQGQVFALWDVASETSLKFIDGDTLPPNTRSFAVSENDKVFVTTNGKSLSLWDLNSFSIIGSLDFRKQLGDASILSLAIISDSVLLAGSSDGSIFYSDLANKVFRKLHIHGNEVVKITIGPDKKHFYSAGNDGKVIVTDLSDFTTKAQYEAPHRITSMFNNHDYSLIFISDALDQQVIWQPWQNSVVTELGYWQQYRFFRLGLFMRDASLLMTTSPKTKVTLWDTTTGEEVANWTATTRSLGSTIIDIQQPSDSKIITVTSDGVIETWDFSPLLN